MSKPKKEPKAPIRIQCSLELGAVIEVEPGRVRVMSNPARGIEQQAGHWCQFAIQATQLLSAVAVGGGGFLVRYQTSSGQELFQRGQINGRWIDYTGGGAADELAAG